MNNYIHLLLNENNTKSFEDFVNKYNQQAFLDYERDFSILLHQKNDYFDYYYKLVVANKQLDSSRFFEMFSINNKELFLQEYEEAVNQTNQEYINQLYENARLDLNLSYQKYDENLNLQILNYLDFLKERHQNLNIIVDEPSNSFDKNLISYFLNVQDNYGDVYFAEKYYDNNEEKFSNVQILQVLDAYEKFENEVQKINSFNLSPFEKFLYVHDFASSRFYNSSDTVTLDSSKCRSFVNVMTDDYIVCVGYAQIMQKFCNELGIECYSISGTDLKSVERANKQTEQDERNGVSRLGGAGEVSHQANIVRIDDDKYNIHGYYFCDACWDCKRNELDNTKHYNYSALPIQDIDKIAQSKYFRYDEIKNAIPELTNYSEPITLDAYKQALADIYRNVYPNFDYNKILIDLENTIRESNFSNAENCFTKQYNLLKSPNNNLELGK